MTEKLVEARQLLEKSWYYSMPSERINYLRDIIYILIAYLEEAEGNEA